MLYNYKERIAISQKKILVIINEIFYHFVFSFTTL